MENLITKMNHPAFDESSYSSILMVASLLSFPTAATIDVDYSQHYPSPTYAIAKTSESSAVSYEKIKTKPDILRPRRKAFIERLLELRKQAISKGMKLLDADEILVEVKRRRGEYVE
ncbi:MAG: hypothetical protein SVR94_16790 [Pseudomonadota bacterium]|nr:hypothetical protein [Pseudomonadota bacterium]